MAKNDMTRKNAATPGKEKAAWRNLGAKRFKWFFLLACAAGLAILFTAAKSMALERDYWEGVRKRFTRNNQVIKAERGNIYDCNGKLLVGSIPVYRLFIDFKVYGPDSVANAKTQAWRNKEFDTKKDSICQGLHEIFPEFSTEWFAKRLQQGRDKQRTCPIYPYPVSFENYKKCLKLPLLREPILRGGFHGDKEVQRAKPYGSLASRLLGSLYPDSDRVPKNGIEFLCDTILRGKDGISHSTKVRNANISLTDEAPIDGLDVVTTIDVDLQDAAEKAIRAQVNALGAEMGVVIVMEAATGDVKAMVNLGRGADGRYYEMMNYAISKRMEPGSTFKTASIMVALEDGVITPETMVDTSNGLYRMHGSNMKDWSYGGRGGFGLIDVKTVMEQSSNIGVSRLIDEHYGSNPTKFVDGLKRVGAGIDLDIPFPGSQNPRMKRPGDDTWSKTTLAWMSIGYESLLPPISTCAFYNGIANNGKLVRPRFIKAVMENGVVKEEFPTEVLREKMCSDKTLKQIRDILENVVSAPSGTGKKARCEQFKVCGKTGTAQVATGKGGYHSGQVEYLISFCGFFPAEAPKYTCLVCIQKKGLPASGGGHCGPVFKEVAQAVMATGMNVRNPALIADSTSVMIPRMSNGNIKETVRSLDAIGIKASGQAPSTAVTWGTCEQTTTGINISTVHTDEGKMPDVRGMGARDAIFALKSRGLKTSITGAGRVAKQSIEPGTEVKAGARVHLTME